MNASLAENLTAQPWAEAVSPEVLAFGTVRGEPVLVRGVDPGAFLRIEGGRWLEAPTTDRGGFAGSGLAQRIRLDVGDAITLVGSTTPRLEVIRIEGLFDTTGPSRDELLVDYGVARSLTGLGPASFHSLRVATSDSAALLAFLESFGASVHVSGPGLPRADVRSEPPKDERLTNLILRSGRGSLPRDYLTAAVAEATNSVRVVALGLMALLALLTVLGVHSVQARAFADRRPDVGVLRAVGADGAWLRTRLMSEVLPVALLAGLLGAALGFVADALLRPAASLVLFGHEIVPVFDVAVAVFVVAATLAASVVSALLLLQDAIRDRPARSWRETPPMAAPTSLEVVLRE